MTPGSRSLAPRSGSRPWALPDDHLIVDGDALVIMDTCVPVRQRWVKAIFGYLFACASELWK